MHMVRVLPSSIAAICRAIRAISSEAGTLAVGASDGAAAAACSLQAMSYLLKLMTEKSLPATGLSITKYIEYLVHLLHAGHHSNAY